MNIKIKLDAISDIKDFVETTNSYPYKQEICKDGFVIDAKSILGILSLDLTKPVYYRCEAEDISLEQDISKYKSEECI